MFADLFFPLLSVSPTYAWAISSILACLLPPMVGVGDGFGVGAGVVDGLGVGLGVGFGVGLGVGVGVATGSGLIQSAKPVRARFTVPHPARIKDPATRPSRKR